MIKVQTSCCALCQLAEVSNDTTIEQFQYAIKRLKKQMVENIEVGITTGNGQTSIFVIVSPHENILENNLKKLSFKKIHNFERRVGYPKTGQLKMYIKNL